MTTPQTVTSRYARNLLVKGTNNEFAITKLERKYAMVQDLQVGYYFEVEIRASTGNTGKWVGATPADAVINCLHHHHGVTFR